jgi:hypothetical protein
MAAPKKPAVTSNQRESRVSTPVVKTTTANQRETRVVTPVKSSGGSGLSAKDRAELLKDFNKAQKMLADITKDRDTLVDQYKRGLGGDFDGTGGSMGSGQQAPMEDAGLAYSKMQDEKAKRNAFALLKDVFTQYGLSELGATLETLMKEGYEPEEATLALKTDVRYNAPYIARFRGNELRRSAGLNVLSEAEYLTLEDDYTKTLKSYGLENYFGATRTLKQTAIADVIGADISAIEFTDRVSTAVDRVKMADPATKNAFQQFYGIGEADLVQYFLDPKKALVNLKERATAAEIGGAAIGQGLTATMTSAEDLARFGINRQQAQAGYAQIGEDLPTAGSLGRIYSESGVTYNQADAESATFKGLASAKRKKEQLKQLEEGQFSGSSGTALGQGALSTQYLRRGSSAGQF